MNLGGLSPDKAPPVEAPLTLFYLMPFFLGLAGLVLAWQGDQVMASRWAPAALAATHFLVLGALAPVMCGALLQMSPVLLGAPYPQVRLVARLTAVGLGLGGVLIGGGFLLSRPGMLLSGGGIAVAGLLVFLVGSFRALSAASGRRETLWAVRLAALALAVTIALGLTLAMVRYGWLQLPQHLRWIDMHVAWGLAGWVGLLLAGVGMEIIPLFYISPAFAAGLKRVLPFAVVFLLLVLGLPGLAPSSSQTLWQWLVAALFVVHLSYNANALYVQRRRQRPRRDANLWLWQLSHVAVFAAFFAWFFDASDSLLGVLLLGGALSFVIGSLMKILPFLTWLDLQQRRVAGGHMQVGLPRLRALLPEALANAVAWTLGFAMAATLCGAFAPYLTILGGILLIVCAVLLAYALVRAAMIRRGVIVQFSPLGQPSRGS
ncbi:MAG: hypothetical protein R3E46_09510 [Sedimenticolaceae bacterium]